MKLDVSVLPEPHSAHVTLVGLLPRVDPQVSEVVSVDPEGPVTLLAFKGFLSGVLQFMGLQSLMDDEPLPAHITREWPFP